MDEFTRECLALKVDRSITSEDVIDTLAELFALRGVPKCIRIDNGPKFIATAIQHWLKRVEVETLYIEPGAPWENRYAESFYSRFRDEFLANHVKIGANTPFFTIHQQTHMLAAFFNRRDLPPRCHFQPSSTGVNRRLNLLKSRTPLRLGFGIRSTSHLAWPAIGLIAFEPQRNESSGITGFEIGESGLGPIYYALARSPHNH